MQLKTFHNILDLSLFRYWNKEQFVGTTTLKYMEYLILYVSYRDLLIGFNSCELLKEVILKII